MEFTSKAKKIWDDIEGLNRLRILNNVWCNKCQGTTSMGQVSGKLEKGSLILSGICTKCGGKVVRLVEHE